MRVLVAALVGALASASPAHAQSAVLVSANNPAGIVKALQQAGYKPELGTDSYGDPKIDLEVAGYTTTMYFYGCDETTRQGCDSIQLRAGFDREAPWTAADALAVTKKYRFAAVWLDEAGDPWVQWDIMTGTGISSKVLLDSVEVFGDTLKDTAELVFAED